MTHLLDQLPGMFGVGLGDCPDASTSPSDQHRCMSVERLHLCVDVTRDGDAITGTVTPGSGAVRNFSGRLGLFSTIDEEIEGIAPHGEPEESKDVDR
jgi:hypothetical protein